MDPTRALPIELGRAVRRRRDPTVSGETIGVVFTPTLLALVRWRGQKSTFERFEDLIEVGTAAS